MGKRDVKETSPNLTLVSSGIIQEIQNGDKYVQDVTALQDIEHEFLKTRKSPKHFLIPFRQIMLRSLFISRHQSVLDCPPHNTVHLVNVTHFPEKNQQFLVELDLLARAWEIGLQQWVVQ